MILSQFTLLGNPEPANGPIRLAPKVRSECLSVGSYDLLAIAIMPDELIDYRSESIRDRVRELTDGKGADVVYDPVGGDAFEQALRAVNWEARMLIIGFASGRVQAVPANLILVKNISVIGVVWGAQTERDSALMSRNLD